MPKPSFGCATCRRRRVKCDERREGCSQCERYGVTCPLYPDTFDVLLRPYVARADTQEHSTVLRGTAEGSRRNVGENLRSDSITPYHQLQPEAEDMALAMYYSKNCVDGGTRWTLERTKAQGNGCLFAAILTLSKAQINQDRSLAGGTVALTESYTNAIRLLNAALADNAVSLEDSTLLATQIMSAVEMKAAPDRSTDYWLAHVQGAATLLQLRGPNQVTTQLGSALFFQITSDLVTSCWLTKRTLPPKLWEVRNAVRENLIDDDHPLWKYQKVIFRFTEFYAAIHSGMYDEESNQAVLEEARTIYEDLVSVFKDADDVWRFRRVSNTGMGDISEYQLEYQSVLSAQLWNGYRIAIILLYTIVTQVSRSLPSTSPLDPFVENAAHVLNETALDTIAAVPLGVNQVRSRQNERAATNAVNICEKGYSSHKPAFHETITSSPGLPYMHGCLLQWSVYFGAQSEFIEPHIRKRLWQILDSAADRLHVKQWQILADELRPTMQLIREDTDEDR